MKSSGVFFLRSRPSAVRLQATGSSGWLFSLGERTSSRGVALFCALWRGPEADRFIAANPNLRPGDCLRLEVDRLHATNNELRCYVTRCELAPPRWPEPPLTGEASPHPMPHVPQPLEFPMRTIDDHKVNPANDTLTITVVDEPGSGGASHRYEVSGFMVDTNPSGKHPDDFTKLQETRPAVILFQNGPITENGVNGLTQEVLLAIVADRLRGFQKGPFACKANACALTHIKEAQHWLQQRTIERMRRGVEGTHTV